MRKAGREFGVAGYAVPSWTLRGSIQIPLYPPLTREYMLL